MKAVPLFFIFFVSVCLFNTQALAQNAIADSNKNDAGKHLVLSYVLKIESRKESGIAESYNGAIKTIFLNDKIARSRMVSLMRVQSIFYSTGANEKITVVKESGEKSYKKNISPEQWRQMNKKYDGATYDYVEDSINILNYNCKKVIIHLKDGKKITAFYSSDLKNDLFKKVEPAFAPLPGVVLQYEYVNKDARFIYTASDISFALTSSEIYSIP